MDFVIALVFGFLWDLLITVICMFIFSAIGIPFLAALTFWQIFGLLIVVSLATTKFS
jgi:hypothetical protein